MVPIVILVLSASNYFTWIAEMTESGKKPMAVPILKRVLCIPSQRYHRYSLQARGATVSILSGSVKEIIIVCIPSRFTNYPLPEQQIIGFTCARFAVGYWGLMGKFQQFLRFSGS